MILLDANVLLRLIQIGHPHQRPAVEAIAILRMRERERCVICPQTLYEMYTVCTRPIGAPSPGLGLAPAVALAHIEKAQRRFAMQVDTAETVVCWKGLVLKYGVTGKSAHDARMAALMIDRAIPRLLTFNDAHFARYTEITAISPFDVIATPS